MCRTLDSWTRTLAECKRNGHPFEHAWALALRRYPPRSSGYMQWGTEGKPRGRGANGDESVIRFARRAFHAAYEDRPLLMSALFDTDGMEAF